MIFTFFHLVFPKAHDFHLFCALRPNESMVSSRLNLSHKFQPNAENQWET